MAQIPTAELIPLKFGLLAWASCICLSGQLTSVPVASPPPLVNKGMWPPDQLCPLLECSVLPVRSVELLHEIVQAGEHSWATTPTIVLMQAGIRDTASPSPLTPPSHAPYLAKGQPAPSPVGSLFATPSFTPASALYRTGDHTPVTPSGHSPTSLLTEPPRLSFTILEATSQSKPVATDPTLPNSPVPAPGSVPPQPLIARRALCPDPGHLSLLH